MVVAIWLFRLYDATIPTTGTDQPAVAGLQVVDSESLGATLADSMDGSGRLRELIINDVERGTGRAVERGDTVSVHYIGTLPNGEEFDNSYNRGEPFTFRVGRGTVIQGWEEGIIGMQVGGKRILVIPPEKGYGSSGFGPIPANANLVFSIELLEIR